MDLEYKTIKNSNPQGKARVYFTCHPDDFDIYFDEISSEILKCADLDCVIYYKRDPATDYTEKDMEDDLKEMKLFVVPVTERFLMDKNCIFDAEYKIAKNYNIPVLFRMQEEDIKKKEKLEKEFQKKFDGVQYLDKFRGNDPTAISYQKKLEDFLFSVLVDNELSKKVREAFVARIFISYRKTDRKYANEIMRLIHQNEFCRDISIWYDEFLVPGEEFNQAIKKAIDDSKLFTLVVTPTLFVPIDNYVIKNEYKEAIQLKIPILSLEMECTDREMLKKYFEDIPEPFDPRDEDILTSILRAQLRDLALDENCNDPQHLYFIGLGYQNGIDVEMNHDLAENLLTASAEGNVPDAMDKLAKMYELGDGVDRNEKKCVYWLEKLVPVREYNARSDPFEGNIYKFFDAMGRLLHYGVNDQRRIKFYELWLLACEYLFNNYEGHNYKEELTEAYTYVADELKESEDFAGAQKYYLKRLNLWEKDLIDEGTGPALHVLADYYYDLACAYHEEACYKEECFSEAKTWYLKTAETHEEMCREKSTAQMRRTLADDYYNLAVICHKGFYFYDQNLDMITPRSFSMDCLQMYEKWNLIANRQEEVEHYQEYGIPDYRKENFAEAKDWCLKSLQLRQDLFENIEERIDMIDMEGLAEIYYEMGIIEFIVGDFSQAKEWCLKSEKLYKNPIVFSGDHYRDELADIYRSLSIICFIMDNDLKEAKHWLEKHKSFVEC